MRSLIKFRTPLLCLAQVFWTIFIIGCNFSDYTKNLPGGFFYVDEGGAIKEILGGLPSGGEIPAKILEYKFNDEFIIAIQKPRIPQEPLYTKRYTYPNIDALYYWIIRVEDKKILGPLSEDEYSQLRGDLKIPESLVLTKE